MAVGTQHNLANPDCKLTNHLNGRNEHRIELSDRYFREIFDSSPDLITVLDKQQRITYINKAASEAVNRPPDDAIGRYCYQLFHATDQPLSTCPHCRLTQDGQMHQEEIYNDTLDTWFLINVSPLYESNGRLIGSVHSARDITALKKTEQALRESEERYHQLSEATLEGVLLSEDAKILAANQVLANMVGYSTQELKGMNMLRFITQQDRKRLITLIKTDQTGDYEFDCLKRDGNVFPIAAHTRQVTYQGRRVYQTAIRDLTQIKQSQQERIKHERLKGVLQMAGAVCHELNQPLMALFGYMDIINSQNATDASLSTSLMKLNKQVVRIQRLTRKLMRVTQYKTKAYAGGEQIIDIDLAASE